MSVIVTVISLFLHNEILVKQDYILYNAYKQYVNLTSKLKIVSSSKHVANEP